MLSELWRITSFRLTLLYGGIFAVAVVGLLGFVYGQAASYQTSQVDQILTSEVRAFSSAPRDQLPGDIEHETRRDFRHINLYGLFAADGRLLAGNMAYPPRGMPLDGLPRAVSPRENPELSATDREVRAAGKPLSNGEILVVARDVALLKQLRLALLRGCMLFGSVVLGAGILGGMWYSWPAVRHIREINSATRKIAAGDYSQRLPTGGRNHELDVLARIVNTMLDETERLMGEVKSCSDNIAHDLRTPLTRLRAAIYRTQQSVEADTPLHAMLNNALTQTDILLGRFRALSRISEIEGKRRLAGFSVMPLEPILRKIVDLYEPLANQGGILVELDVQPTATIECDGELLFEAISNLVDNAIKFTPPNGRVKAALKSTPDGPVISITDSGPGIPEDQRKSVLQRFYRVANTRNAEGSGLGLSLVDAIVRLHGFTLILDESEQGGTHAQLCCWQRAMVEKSTNA
jgi:signal transduction histidine kinase